jgi:4-amino-4-deoxy-L-arabinose transferase-like glycosyltransferase
MDKSFLLLFFKKEGLPSSSYWWRLGLLSLTLIRLAVAARAPLSADETYYWVWSRALAAGYLDHPPMVALWIRAGCAVAGHTALGVRLLGPVAALLGTLLLAKAAEDLAPGRHAGIAAGLLLNATLACNAGAVVMTPDTPLLFFWTAALAALARLLRTGHANWWLAAGLAAGLALDSKYTAALLGASVVAWLVLVPSARRWWGAWQLCAAGALALALFAPVLAWNAAHHWASFAKQGGRTGDWQPAQALRFLAELLGGQLGLATPAVAAVFAAGAVRAVRAARLGRAAAGLLACVILVPAAVFAQHALGGRVQANWPAVIYPGAALAAACLGAAPVRFWRPAAAFGLAVAAVVFLQAAAAPFALPRALDFTLIRLAGWSDLAGAVFVAKARNHADFVAADEYGLASQLAFRLRGPVLGAEPRWALFNLPRARMAGRTGLLVRSLRDAGGPDPRFWQSATPVGDVARGRAGTVAETYRLYLVVPRPDAPPAALVVLPEPPPLPPDHLAPG